MKWAEKKQNRKGRFAPTPFYKGKNKKVSGFTLIELLVAMSIFVLLSAGFILKYSTTNAGQEMHAAVTQMVGVIKEARHDSISVLEYKEHTGIFPSYGIMFDMSDPTNVTLYADCVADDTGNGVLSNHDTFSFPSNNCVVGGATTDGFVKKIPLESGAKITAIRSVVGATTTDEQKAYVEFIRPIPIVWLTGETTGVLPYGRVEVDVSSGDHTRQVEVYTSGLITPTLSGN